MANYSAILATTTLNSSNAHPKRSSQFLSSIVSAPSAPVAPESFDATHVTSYSMKSRGTVLGTSSYYSKAAHGIFSTGGGLHVRVLLLENICNQLPGFSVLVIWEEKTPPLPVDCPMDGLTQLT